MWALPTPGLWNKYGILGNNYNADGINATGNGFHLPIPVAFLFTGIELACHQIGC